MRSTAAIIALVTLAGCAPDTNRSTAQPPTPPIVAVGGFSRPEAVKYDPAQDVFFVSNFGLRTDNQLDNNGFISRMRPDGTVDSLRFIAGGRGTTLHMPRGMTLHGDTLWVADVDGLRGFDRRTGAPLHFVDFAAQAHGFLNDVTVGGDGALYLTDTDSNRVYRIGADGIRAEALAGVNGPNGILWDSAGNRFLLAPYRAGNNLYAWAVGSAPAMFAGGTSPGEMDGLEIIGRDSILVASQRDSSLHIVTPTSGVAVIRLRGEPADIAWNGGQRVVAVPYIARDTVELFRVP